MNQSIQKYVHAFFILKRWRIQSNNLIRPWTDFLATDELWKAWQISKLFMRHIIRLNFGLPGH